MTDTRNVDQLRHSIDQGLTGDKVAHSDPAAAPLGTDAEAGGVSPTPLEIAKDAKAIAGREQVHTSPSIGPAIYCTLVLLVGAAAITVMFLAR